jgi:hypothetical protein
MVSKQPGENMFFVERPSSGFAPHEAAVPDVDVVDETSGAEKDDLAVLIDDRTVTGLSPHHSSLRSAFGATAIDPKLLTEAERLQYEGCLLPAASLSLTRHPGRSSCRPPRVAPAGCSRIAL